MKKISLSKITIALSLCYATQFSYADIQSANGNTQVFKQKGVEVVNIATPSQAGLSHNQYNKYNVDKSGAVLNNAVQNSQSQLAGNVAKNPNLNQRAATVILNEVVSRNPSHIAGAQEIVGQRADYVLANPNGISVENGQFINTQRASLVVGKPTVEQGKLKGYQVNGDNALNAKGTIAGASNVDLIAPKVNVAGNLKNANGNVNVVMGRNEIQRDDDGGLTINVLPQQGKVLDGKIAGSIQAGRIRIHSTDERANLAVTSANLDAKEVIVTAGNVKLDGTTSKTSKAGNEIYVERNKTQVRKANNTDTETFAKTTIKADTAVIVAQHNLETIGAEINAKDATIIGGKTHLGAAKTKTVEMQNEYRNRGGMNIGETKTTTVEKVIPTTITANSLKLVATENKLTAKGVKFDVNSAVLHSEKGIDIRGEKAFHFYDASATFNNAPKIGTGRSFQRATAADQVNSEMNVKNDLIVSGGDIGFFGTTGRIDGDFIVKNTGKLQFGAEDILNTNTINDKQKYWGGLLGSKYFSFGRHDQEKHGSDFTVKGGILADSQKGVAISGSRVIAGKEALVKANDGHLVIESTLNRSVERSGGRKGTIFDITKERSKVYKREGTQNSAQLASTSNLILVSNKDVNIVASSIQAGQLLDISALGKINIRGANNQTIHRSQHSGLSFSAKVDKPTVSFDKEGAVKSSIDVVKGLINGTVTAADIENVARNNLKFKGEASATFGFYKREQYNSSHTNVASNVVGATTQLVAGKVNVDGSQVATTKDDLNIKANSVTTSAALNETQENKRNTTFGITNTVTVTESALTNKLTLGLDHKRQATNVITPEASQLSAAKDVNIQANNAIEHKGTVISAGQNITETAKQISHLPEHKKQTEAKNNFDLGLTLTTSVDKTKAVNGSLVLGISGGRENHLETNAQSTNLKAGSNILVNADRLQDVGTQYQAGKNVTLNSKEHNIQSAENTKKDEKLSAGVTIGVSASTKDFTTATVGANLGIHFQHDKSNSTTASIANVQGGNVNINTGKLNSQADISATNNVNINAQSANFTQSQNTSAHKGGGFTLNVGVGAIVIPAATAAVPSVDVSFTANGHKGNRTDAVLHTVQGGNNVDIHGKEGVNLQGTNVNAGNTVSITGNTVNVQPGKSQVQDLNVSVGGGVSIGANTSSLGINGNVNVHHENSTTHQGTSINGQNVNIKAENGVSLTGVTSNSKTLNIDGGKGDVILNSAKNNVNKTDVEIGGALSGGISKNKWTPASGSGKVNVDVVRNETHTTTNLNTQNATISGHNAHFDGSSINAQTVNNNLKGSVTSNTVTDKINETSVHLSASGSGKFTPYPADKWAESAKKDWENGTIAGVKADVKVNVDAKKKETVISGGINPPKPQVVKNQATKVDVNFTTAQKARLELMIKQRMQRQRH